MAFRDDIDLTQLAVRRVAGTVPGARSGGGTPIAPQRRVVSRYVVPAALIVGFVVIFGWAARDTYLPRRPVTVAPVLVSLADVQTAGTPLFKAAGWIEPRPTPIRVTALAPGVVEDLLVVEDQEVAAGQPIARLVRRDAELAAAQARAVQQARAAEVEQARAALQAAQVRHDVPAHLELVLAEAEAALAAVETELSNLPFAVQRAEARLRVAEADLTTKQKARDALSGIIVQQAQSEFDAARAEAAELTSRRPALERQRDSLQRRREAAATRLELKVDEVQALETARAALAAAEAQLQQAQVAVAEAELRLERMTICAPVAGRVLDLVAAPGTQLMAGGVSLMEGRDGSTVVTMYQPQRLQVRVDVRFEDLPRVGREQPVLVESPAVAQPLHGEVLFLTGFANIQKNTLEVKVALHDPPPVLKPEMLVDVTFLSAGSETEQSPSDEYRLFIPRQLVETTEGGSAVWVADLSAGVARRVRLTLGTVETPTLVEVAAGLTAGSRLIASGSEGLRDGMRIDVRGEDATVGITGTTQPPAHSNQSTPH